MDQLIPIVNKLQDVFGAIGHPSIDLPQITVVGSQSAGKSSVLENIVGRDFLPRGSGIVTRRPLVLQLYSLPDEGQTEGTGEEWGEFLHLPGQKFFDFSEIRAEIQRETDRVTGKNKGISNKSINLRIYSPYVLNLTLVDLPGITKVPTGDQPEDVEQQILSMCMEFISNPNAIILAVSAANQDLANSEGLKLARSVDPEGVRTIGVLTKVDIMDHGTDCSDILDNKVIPLRRGYVAVMNRSQKDINDNISIRKGLQKEQAFFQAHQNYRTMLTRCGTKNLSRTLNQMLMHHIRDCLPQIRNKVNSLLSNVTRDLNSLGECIDDQGASAKGAILLRILSQFASNFANHIEGKGGPNNEFSDMTELYGGARISHIFNEIYGKIIKSVDPFEGLTDEDIRTAIANANGIRPSLFVPEISFDLLVKRQIARLEQPGLQCADLVMEEMQRMIGQSETLELSRFPDLRDRTIEIVNQLLKNCVIPTQNMIANMVLIEKAYINTSHPDFIGGKAAVTTAQQSRKLASNPDGRDGRNGINAIVNNENALNDPNAGNSGKVPFSPPATPGQPNAGGFMSFFQSPSGAKPGAGSYRNSANMSNPGKDEFFGGIRLPQVPDRMRCNSVPTDRERVETEIIKTLISSYYDIVKKNFLDFVPKTVMHFLVNNFKENLQNELVSQLYRENVLNDIMKEADDVAAKRKTFRDMSYLLMSALDILNEIRDFQPNK